MTATTLLSHEWLAPIGGSENVFEVLAEIYPGADAICLWNEAPKRFDWPIGQTWLARSPLKRSKALSLPFMASAWNRVNLDPYDRVISSSHAFGHHLAGRAAREGRSAYAYVHSPARYIWAPEHDGRGRTLGAAFAAKPLRWRDRRATDAGVQYAANSEFIRDRIRAAWDRDAAVIYPPVDVDVIQSASSSLSEQLNSHDAQVAEGLPDAFVLGASRLVEYKRLDRVVQVGASLQLPVVIAGSGPDEERLRDLARSARVPVHFVGRVSDSLLHWLYASASLFVFLAIEDFGIMPVEAIASGTPALVNSVGGAAEIIRITGGGAVTADLRLAAVREAAANALSADMEKARLAARHFSRAAFSARVVGWSGLDRPLRGH